jgi:conjugative transfer signal peptidase TraF
VAVQEGGRGPGALPPGRVSTRRRTVALLVVLGGLLLSTRWLTLNIQPSVPYGLYLTGAVPAHVERGMLVTVWPPAVIHPWHPWYQRLLKPIAGIPGDQVCILDEGLWVNDEPYGPVLTEAHGKPLPRLRGCFAVEPGQVFVATKTRRTLDGRYFGTLPISRITALATPLWVWQ